VRFRKLRIAWSVVCLIACVLLIVLWVRSYSYQQSLYAHFPVGGYLQITGCEGVIEIIVNDEKLPPGLRFNDDAFRGRKVLPWSFGFTPRSRFGGWRIDCNVPYWFAVALGVACSVVPWLPSRFKLRTLLIATTLVAVVLGLIVWAAR
jgi:hypothetical protein